jgi:hypothetical protein
MNAAATYEETMAAAATAPRYKSPVSTIYGSVHLHAQVALLALCVLSVINARNNSSGDADAFAPERVANDVHFLLQSGVTADVQLHRTLPKSRLADSEESQVHLRSVTRSRCREKRRKLGWVGSFHGVLERAVYALGKQPQAPAPRTSPRLLLCAPASVCASLRALFEVVVGYYDNNFIRIT